MCTIPPGSEWKLRSCETRQAYGILSDGVCEGSGFSPQHHTHKPQDLKHHRTPCSCAPNWFAKSSRNSWCKCYMLWRHKQRVSLQLGGTVLVQHEQTLSLISSNTKEKKHIFCFKTKKSKIKIDKWWEDLGIPQVAVWLVLTFLREESGASMHWRGGGGSWAWLLWN